MSEFYLPHVERNISRTNALLSLGCCVRCTLRALRVTHPSCYRIPYHELESKVRSILSQAKVSESPTHTDTKPDESDTTLSTTEDTTTCIDTAKPNSDPMSENTVEDAVTVDDAVSKSIQGTKRTQTDTEIGEGGSNGPKKQKLDNQERVCVVCLGMLQTTEANMPSVRENILHEGYDVTSGMTVTLKVSLPAAVLVRQALVSARISATDDDAETNSTPAALALFDEVSLKDVIKYIYFPTISEALGGVTESSNRHLGTISLALDFTYPKTDSECSFLIGLNGLKAPVRVKISRVNRFLNKQNNKDVGGWIPPKPIGWNNMRECLSTMTAIKLTNAATKSCIATTPTPVATALASPAVTISMQTVYIAGRYNKYSKELSQTPWMLNGVLKTPHSVLSRMESHFLTATKCSSVVFSSSGREDVDVRMLGRGRPFVMECVNPKRQMTTAMLSTLQRTVNESCSDMRINDIQVVTKEETLRNREDDSDKRKKYLATVTFAEAQTDDSIKALNETGEFLIQQQTPVRVLHRRPLLTRPRMIYASHLQLTSPFNGLLTLTTQAGTYIKEFCHGDLGRTVPNLSTFLKCDCDISDLDVADVEMDWPPRIEQDF